METPAVRSRLAQMLLWGGGLLAVAAVSGALAATAGPVFVPLAVVGIIGGLAVLMQPALGFLAMFALTLIKPEATQGLGVINPANLIAAVLVAILVLSVILGGPADFLRSNQVRLLGVLGVLFLLNWLIVGRIDPPEYMISRDQTTRTLLRHATHLALVSLIIAFIRTPRQLLALTGVFLGCLAITIPGALGRGDDSGTTKVEALRAVGSSGVELAENANRLAFLSLMAITLIWFALHHYRSRIVRAGGIASMLVLVLIVFKSGSRSGVLLLGLLIVGLLIQSGVKPGYLLFFVLAGGLAAGIVVMLVPDAVMERLLSLVVAQEYQPRSLVESNLRRQEVLAAGLKMFAANPLMGIGVGNFRWVTALDIEHGGLSMAAHNAYLLALAEGGLVLLGGYLLLFVVTLRDLSRLAARSALYPEVGLGWLVLATRTNLLLLLGFSVFAEGWKEFFFALILGTSGALVMIYRRAARARGARPA
jgi:O-antigen ligase